MHHEHWRREACRHLGYGFVDPEDAIACAADRATMWATGTIGPEGSVTFDVPIPAVFGSNANPREVRATLAWFAPIRPGYLAYRAVKLRIPTLQTDALETAGIGTITGNPPTVNRRAVRSLIAGGATLTSAVPGMVPLFRSRSNVSEIKVRRLSTRPFPLGSPLPWRCQEHSWYMIRSSPTSKFDHARVFERDGRWPQVGRERESPHRRPSIRPESGGLRERTSNTITRTVRGHGGTGDVPSGR